MLLDAQNKAAQLFDEIERGGLIRAGVTERALSDEIRDMAAEMFGVDRHWHKRIVRAGENTLQPYRENPPDRTIADDDILFCDFGPIFDKWEADFGRTFVLGDDPVKRALRDDLPVVWARGRDYFEGTQQATAFVDAGHQLRVSVRRNSTSMTADFTATFTGYLVTA